MEQGREPACPLAPFIPHLERQSAYTWPPGGSAVALSPVAPLKWQQQRGSGCPSLAAKAQTWLLRIPQQARSQEEPQFFFFNAEEVKNQTRVTVQVSAPLSSSLCFLPMVSPALCALVGPSPLFLGLPCLPPGTGVYWGLSQPPE